MILFWLAGHVVIGLLLLVAVVQAGVVLIIGQPNLNLQEFTVGLNRYLYQMACFLTFNSETKPFPFSDWPTGLHADVTSAENTGK